jgi:hypothetical protein
MDLSHHGAISRLDTMGHSELEFAPVWSPKTSELLFSRGTGGRMRLLRQAPNGGPAKLVLDADGPKWPNDWSSEGRFITYSSQWPDYQNMHVWVLALSDSEGEKPRQLLQQGHDMLGCGKIERYFRSVREQFLANLDRKQTLSLEDLNERLWAWIDNAYHRTEHSSLGTTPLVRWQGDIEHVRQLPPDTDLRRLFFHRLNRLVRRDCTFLLQNRYYEAPPQLAGETIEVRFDPLDAASVEIYLQGKAQGVARLVDPVVNAQLPSDKPSKAAEPEPTGINFVDLLIKKKGEEEPPW